MAKIVDPYGTMGGPQPRRRKTGAAPRTAATPATAGVASLGRSADERTIKPAGRTTKQQDTRPSEHGSRPQKRLLTNGLGGAVNWGIKGSIHVYVSGEKPGHGRQR